MSAENKPVSKEDWQRHSVAWESSGLSKMEYCTQQGIHYQRFIYHSNRRANKAKPPKINFIEAKPETVTVNTQTVGLQLMLPNGIRIGISNEVNPLLLKTVLSIAGSLSC